MANENGTEHSYKVYKMVKSGYSIFFGSSFYAPLFVISFKDKNEAVKWIIENGKRKIDYTIVEVFRNL
jgi:hypothetical protein